MAAVRRFSLFFGFIVISNEDVEYISNCLTRCNTNHYLLFCKFTLHVSGVNHTHHQDYTKLRLQPPVLVIFFVQLPLATLEGGS